MKKINIWVIPTDKPSKVFIIDKSKMFLSEPSYLSFSKIGGRVHKIENSELYQPQNIYITSNEEIISLNEINSLPLLDDKNIQTNMSNI